MEMASQLYDDSASLKSINRVRMAYNIHDVSSICTADGKSLCRQYYGCQTLCPVRNHQHWPVKHHVLSADYTIWNKFLKRVFTVNPNILPFPLGKWLWTLPTLHHGIGSYLLVLPIFSTKKMVMNGSVKWASNQILR